MFTLKKAGFKFNYLMNDELAEDGSCKGKVFVRLYKLYLAYILI
jgi:hypothetical protein